MYHFNLVINYFLTIVLIVAAAGGWVEEMSVYSFANFYFNEYF